MAMRKKPKAEPAAREYVMGQAQRVTGHASLSTGLSAVNFKLDELRTEMRAGFAKTDVKFDKVMTVLDTVVGKLHDNDQSHIAFGAMLRDRRLSLEAHEQRLTALESRLPPSTP